MEFMQLEMFVAVVEERSFARAAERVFRTQPAVSIGLRKLEEQLGTSLLDRSSRTAHRLTPAGEFVYESASRMVALKKEALSMLRGEKDTSPARLSLGVNGDKGTSLVTQLGTKFCAANPDVRLAFFSGESESFLRDIADRRLDAAFLPARSQQEATKRGFVAYPLPVSGSPDGLCFVLSKTGRSHTLRMFEEMVLSEVELRTRSDRETSLRNSRRPAFRQRARKRGVQRIG
jgi:DNA-binding transcriptional LysR family regulator